MQGKQLAEDDREKVMKTLKQMDSVLSILPEIDENIDSEVEALIEERNKARADKDFARSDEIRDELAVKGITLEDTPEGTIWKKT